MKLNRLFIDELGYDDPRNKTSPIYILCGSSIEENHSENIKVRADQIKYKYWNRTDIVFHSREIGMNLGDFKIFTKRKKLKDGFLTDLLSWLREFPFLIFICVVDKEKARKKGWNRIKVIRETSRKLFYHYLASLLGSGNIKGKIIIESATSEKDQYYLLQFSYFLSPGCIELSVDYKKIQDILTSISFVTKKNFDIEEQIADLFAYAARCKYLRMSKQETFKIGSYEDKIIRILDQKLFKIPVNAKAHKKTFFEKINPFCILPEK